MTEKLQRKEKQENNRVVGGAHSSRTRRGGIRTRRRGRQGHLRTGRIHCHCCQGKGMICEGHCGWQCQTLSEVEEGESGGKVIKRGDQRIPWQPLGE